MNQVLRFAYWAGAGLAFAAPGLAAPLHFVTKPFAPYAYAGPDGRPAGPLVELLHAACAEAGLHCQVEVLPWRRALGMASRGEVDGLFPVVDSPARRAAFYLSPEVVRARYVLVARRGAAPGGDERAALSGRTVAAYGPSDAMTTLRQLGAGQPDVRVEIEPDQLTVLRKLSAGRYGHDGLALVNETAAQALSAAGGLAGLRPVSVVKHLVYAYAFVPTRVSAGQTQAFDDAIRTLCHRGRIAEIFKPYGLPAAGCRPAARRSGMQPMGFTAHGGHAPVTGVGNHSPPNQMYRRSDGPRIAAPGPMAALDDRPGAAGGGRDGCNLGQPGQGFGPQTGRCAARWRLG